MRFADPQKRIKTPNKRPALGVATALGFHFGRHWRRAGEAGRSTRSAWQDL
jgi:hypothetical protein